MLTSVYRAFDKKIKVKILYCNLYFLHESY